MPRIATFNCNSVRTRLPVVLRWLKENQPDVLALQETKVTDDQFPREAFAADGWTAAIHGQKSYNGVAFLSRTPLAEVTAGLPVPGFPEEARYLSARWGDVTLINTYVPQGYLPEDPKFEKKLRFFAELGKRFAPLHAARSAALWMGDLNVAPTAIDLWDPKRNAEHVCFHPKARAAFDEVRRAGWIDLFREFEPGPDHYTYWDYMIPTNLARNRGWRIDHILGTGAIRPRVKNVWIDRAPRSWEKPSDHTFVVADLD
jgi:exodeoxyribonuclease-3